MTRSIALLSALLVGCGSSRGPEDYSDWFGPMGDRYEDVMEPVEFTDQPYAYPEQGPGIAGLSGLFEDFNRFYASTDPPPAGCSDWQTTSDLPQEMWVMATIHPRYYFKTDGCSTQADAGDSDEKYYGSFFIEDGSGGMFVLGDSKVAHFDIGDRLKIRIRGVQRNFGLDMVVAHDIIEIDRGPYPVYYRDAPELVGNAYPDEWIGSVVRVEGEVVSDPDTFGEFAVLGDNGSTYLIGLDVELNRRKVRFPVGSRIRATGPVQRAFGDKIIIMRIGQVERLDNIDE